MFYEKFNFLIYKYIIKINIKKFIGYKSKFKDKWTLWFHNFRCNDWSIKSYQKLIQIGSICDFWRLYNNYYSLKYGMFFLMKNDIMPIWEADENKNGGNWSIKIVKNIETVWLNLSIDLVSGNLDNGDIVNGISICYKNNYYIIKIWINDLNKNDINNINISSNLKNNIIFNKYK
tara:strand:+ start:428 stop:952 length:525 start_codon:yes stop_codon:yes gene_type:complete